jgi:hypothetical protein
MRQPGSDPQQRLSWRYYVTICVREALSAQRRLVEEVGPLAALREFELCKQVALECDEPPTALAKLMRDAVRRAENGGEFGEGKAWRRVAADVPVDTP